ncbi:flagellar biosynthesis protein FlhB [Mesobaculum littorinae]|uniref:Flagellar biosynthesis protein FlhB n=1 Tax=Mesobaculum littorinae TaxID=2486419 RepID=A0A438AGX7_9RHOB|nr:flagellar type III secretion system protein FlhB [Mesobaculum littorinae]RVV97966.1 flagellar biosynthesis protein FlhB [Mesobaculum littorinae]
MSGSDDEDKQYDPSAKKLEDARKKGEVPRSTDLNTAAAYGGLLLAGAAFGAGSLTALGAILASLIARADQLSGTIFAGGGTGRAPLAPMVAEVLLTLAPWFALPAAMVVLSVIAQRSFVVAPSKLAPKANRVSPLSNAKNKFGRSGLFEFAKSFVKLMVYAVLLFAFLNGHRSDLVGAMKLDTGPALILLLGLTFQLMTIVLAIALVFGGVDFLWQRADHMRRNRMSHKEMMDEHKEAEGDPHMKGQRRQRAQEIATNKMLADVPTADVILVNPTHYAVALKWDPITPSAPICVAKGVDEIALRIREIAMESAVPIRRDPPTARALYAVVELGDEIRPEHYAAVAAAIRFARDIRRKARAR